MTDYKIIAGNVDTKMIVLDENLVSDDRKERDIKNQKEERSEEEDCNETDRPKVYSAYCLFTTHGDPVIYEETAKDEARRNAVQKEFNAHNRQISTEYVPSEENLANVLTEVLGKINTYSLKWRFDVSLPVQIPSENASHFFSSCIHPKTAPSMSLISVEANPRLLQQKTGTKVTSFLLTPSN
ncbi:hypothetical protein WA026_016121 [Henosepilachna vigintioctopunctata]|uniref:Uncharacterized protein n=1 Tax=Henosepilachna vigintioctopunctata TaxID=420089 RepID=A0AAW1TUS5_9CUCU